MSFWSSLEADINKGLEVAGILVGSFVPQYSNILEDIATVVGDIEEVFGSAPVSAANTAVSTVPAAQVIKPTIPQEKVSQLVQAATTMSVIKQHAASKINS